jgi:hypothetical protein
MQNKITPTLEDEEKCIAIVALALSSSIIRVHRKLCPNLQALNPGFYKMLEHRYRVKHFD